MGALDPFSIEGTTALFTVDLASRAGSDLTGAVKPVDGGCRPLHERPILQDGTWPTDAKEVI